MMKFLRSINPAIAAIAIIAIIAALLVTLWPNGDQRSITAEFPRTVSLYKGSDVKILGVAVGKVDSVNPAGTKVVVKLHYDGKYKVPADAKAAVISPSIVGDRFIQLTPVYKSGPTLPDNARLGLTRTATPLELDEIFGSLNDLNIAMGPKGANAPDETGKGALSRLLDSTARNFGGQGVQFNKTLKNLGKFTQTLSNNKDKLFGTAAEVEKFTNTFAKNDDTIRRFNDSLASGANLLAAERGDLARVLVNLGVAMRQVRGFVHDNRKLLGSNIRGLNKISKILVKRRSELNEILTTAPVALNNLALAYDSNTGTLDTRAAVGESVNALTRDPAALLCGILGDGSPASCNTLSPILNLLGLGRTGALLPTAGQGHREVGRVDPSLGGLVAVQR